MNLVWKLLRQHISIPQFVGFFFANLFGMFVVLLGIQFYHDVLPVFTAEDSFMRADYLVMSKRIGTGGLFPGAVAHLLHKKWSRWQPKVSSSAQERLPEMSSR